MQTGSLAAALALAALTLSGCGDSTGLGSKTGSLSFSYSGARSGSFSASGEYRATTTSFVKQPFAVGSKGVENGVAFISVLSYQPVTSTTGDVAIVLLPNVTAPTTLSLDSTCDTDACPLAAVVFDTDPDVDEDESDFYVFDSGTLQVTSVASGRITGTFSGTATEFLSDAAITVTNGTFDVPLVSQSALGSRMVSIPRFRAARR
jgi:hypothetical protein